MEQIKIFSEEDKNILEKQINEFLKGLKKIRR